MSARSRKFAGTVVATALVAGVAFFALGAPVTAKPDPPPPSDDTTTTTSPSTPTTTGPDTTTTTTTTPPPPPLTLVLSETYEVNFPDVPSSPGLPTIEAPPATDEPAPTTTTVAPVASTTSTSTTTTSVPPSFDRTRDRIVVSGVVLEAPPTVLGSADTFARAYGTTGALNGVVAVQGTETVDGTTRTFAQPTARATFDGTLRSVGGVSLTFVTTVPQSTSSTGEGFATESGRILGLKGWQGTITLRYRVTDSGNSRGTYRAVFTRTHG